MLTFTCQRHVLNCQLKTKKLLKNSFTHKKMPLANLQFVLTLTYPCHLGCLTRIKTTWRYFEDVTVLVKNSITFEEYLDWNDTAATLHMGWRPNLKKRYFFVFLSFFLLFSSFFLLSKSAISLLFAFRTSVYLSFKKWICL